MAFTFNFFHNDSLFSFLSFAFWIYFRGMGVVFSLGFESHRVNF